MLLQSCAPDLIVTSIPRTVVVPDQSTSQFGHRLVPSHPGGKSKGEQARASRMCSSINILLREFWQFVLDIRPRLLTPDQTLYRFTDCFLVGSDLLGGVPISQSKGVVLDRLEIDGDAQRRPELIVSGIPLAYTCRGVIDPIGDLKLTQLVT